MYTLGRSLDYCGVPAIAAETQCLGGRKLSCHIFSILCRAENTWRYFHGGRYLPGGSAVSQVLAVSPRLSIVSTDGGLAVLEAQVHHLALQSFFLSPSSSTTHTHFSSCIASSALLAQRQAASSPTLSRPPLLFSMARMYQDWTLAKKAELMEKILARHDRYGTLATRWCRSCLLPRE